MAKKEEKMTKDIMKDIENDEIQMRSKLYFRLLSIALVGATGLFLLLSSLTILIALRDIQYGNTLGARGFGPHNTGDYIQTLPWLAIVSGLLTFVVAYILIKHFDFSYKRRFYTIIAALVFAIAGLGVVFATTGIESKLSTGPLDNLMTFSRFSEENIITGEIVSIEENGDLIINAEDGEVRVVVSEEHSMRKFTYEVGDVVSAVGEWNGDTLEAYGVRPGDKPRSPHMRGNPQRFLK